MTETLKPVEDMIDDSPVVDVREQFEQFREILAELKAKIEARFELTRDPSTVELDSYGTTDGGRRFARGLHRPGDRLDGALLAGQPQRQLRQPAPDRLARPAGQGAAPRHRAAALARGLVLRRLGLPGQHGRPTASTSTSTTSRSTRSGCADRAELRVRVLRQPGRVRPGQPVADGVLLLVRATATRTSTWSRRVAQRPRRPLAALGRRGRAGAGRGAGRARRDRPADPPQHRRARPGERDGRAAASARRRPTSWSAALWGGDRELPRPGLS